MATPDRRVVGMQSALPHLLSGQGPGFHLLRLRLGRQACGGAGDALCGLRQHRRYRRAVAVADGGGSGGCLCQHRRACGGDHQRYAAGAIGSDRALCVEHQYLDGRRDESDVRRAPVRRQFRQDHRRDPCAARCVAREDQPQLRGDAAQCRRKRPVRAIGPGTWRRQCDLPGVPRLPALARRHEAAAGRPADVLRTPGSSGNPGGIADAGDRAHRALVGGRRGAWT